MIRASREETELFQRRVELEHTASTQRLVEKQRKRGIGLHEDDDTEMPSKPESETDRRHRRESRCVECLRGIGSAKRKKLLTGARPGAVAVKQEKAEVAEGVRPDEDMATLVQPRLHAMVKSSYVWLYLLALLPVPFACMALSDGSGASDGPDFRSAVLLSV